MKVLFLHNAVPEYRIEFWRLLSSFCNLDLLITSKGLDKKIYNLEKDSSGLSINYLNWSNINHWLNEATNYDVVILPPVDDVYLYIISKMFLHAGLRASKKVVLWTEGWIWHKIPIIKKLYKECMRLLMRDIGKQCDVCIASGKQSYHSLQKLGIDRNKLAIAVDSSTSPKYRNDSRISIFDEIKNRRVILFLGRIVKRKGCNLLIKAFDNLYKDNKDVCLLIGGEGPELEGCKKLASGLASIDHIHFIGKVQPSQRAYYYKKADVFVLPSYAYHGTVEAWGLTVNESMEQGTPVVATNVVGAAYDLLNTPSCGIMVKENSIRDLQIAISKILAIPRNITRDACLKEYSKYSVNNMAKSFYDIISR